MDARNYIIDNFLIDLDGFDIVVGYRADDSYFSFAEAFVQNGLPLRSLNMALKLGRLGEQTVLVSEKALGSLEFMGADPVERKIYYPKFTSRDAAARDTYRREVRGNKTYRDDIFVMDIIREGMRNDDPRIQRIVSE